MPSTDLCLFWYNVISLCLSLCLPPAVLFLLSLSLLVTGTFFLFGIVTYISRHLFSRISILSSFGFVTLQHIFVRTMIYAVIKHWYMQNLFDFCQVLHFFSPFNSSLKCNSWAILVVLKMPTKEQYSEKGKSFSFTKWFQTMTLRRYSDTLILVNLMRKKASFKFDILKLLRHPNARHSKLLGHIVWPNHSWFMIIYKKNQKTAPFLYNSHLHLERNSFTSCPN